MMRETTQALNKEVEDNVDERLFGPREAVLVPQGLSWPFVIKPNPFLFFYTALFVLTESQLVLVSALGHFLQGKEVGMASSGCIHGHETEMSAWP
jgi:hypothetical protein